jgi:hypothetical protein
MIRPRVRLYILAFAVAGSVIPRVAHAQGGSTQDTTRKLVPPGFGTLKQDEFTVPLRDGPLLIKVTPLTEQVIRTAAPDTYDRLHKLAESRKADAERLAGANPNLELFLVSFFSYQADVEYQPESLQITHQGRQMRASAIVPVSSAFGQQRLKQQDNQIAVYAFAGPFSFEQPLGVRYNAAQSDAWTAIWQKIVLEHGKIVARSKS